ncbi:MAG: hypothetical protein JXA09_17940, partial [Anaerolineae bacterium]|nr:hypothetical protein [Anaerolineae bacterium]
MYDAKPRSQARILSQLLSQTVPQLLLALALVATGAWAARADNDGVYLTVKSGQPGELLADGKSRTILEAHLDPGAACWKQAIEAEGAFTLQVSTSLGTIEPTLATGTLSQFPMPLTLIAGTTSGTALVDVRAYYCPPGAVGAFGVCSDPQSQQNVCLANLSISIGDAAPAPAQPQPPAAPEEAPAFSASLSTVPPLPVEGGVVTCTVRVEGAREGESLAYTWYVDSDQAATTSTPTWTWDPALAGRHAIGVDVLGDARSLELSVEIDVQAKPAQEAPQAEGGAQAPAQPPQQPGVQPPVPAQPPQAGAGQGEDAAEPPGVRQPERPFKPSQGETGYPDPGEPGSPGAGAVEARGPVEELIEGEVARAPTAREAALAGALTGGAAIVKLALDLEAVRRARQVRDATPDLP